MQARSRPARNAGATTSTPADTGPRRSRSTSGYWSHGRPKSGRKRQSGGQSAAGTGVRTAGSRAHRGPGVVVVDEHVGQDRGGQRQRHAQGERPVVPDERSVGVGRGCAQRRERRQDRGHQGDADRHRHLALGREDRRRPPVVGRRHLGVAGGLRGDEAEAHRQAAGEDDHPHPPQVGGLADEQHPRHRPARPEHPADHQPARPDDGVDAPGDLRGDEDADRLRERRQPTLERIEAT